MHKQVLGTQEIARLCRCSPRLVSRWIDEGTLPGFKLPGSECRRVTKTDLLAFMALHAMPDEWIAELKASL